MFHLQKCKAQQETAASTTTTGSTTTSATTGHCVVHSESIKEITGSILQQYQYSIQQINCTWVGGGGWPQPQINKGSDPGLLLGYPKVTMITLAQCDL